MRNLLLPALATVLASCAPLMQQSLPSGATSRTFTTTCTTALNAVVTQAHQQKPSSTGSEWGAWAVQGRTTTSVTLQARNGSAVAMGTITCTQAGKQATLTMRSSGPNITPRLTNEGFLQNLDLPK